MAHTVDQPTPALVSSDYRPLNRPAQGKLRAEARAARAAGFAPCRLPARARALLVAHVSY